jgi:hypothetical protein
VNQTPDTHKLSLQTLSQLSYPPLDRGTYEPLRLTEVLLPDGALWVHALDYAGLKFATSRPTDNLVPEGYLRGEKRVQDSVGGSLISERFGQQAGDSIEYRIDLPCAMKDASVVWRYSGKKGDAVRYRVTGAATTEFMLQGTGGYATAVIPLGSLVAGSTILKFISLGGSRLNLNGFAIVETESANKVQFKAKPWQRDPIVDIKTVPGSVILEYGDLENCYGFRLAKPLGQPHKLTWMQLDDVFGPSDPLMKDRRVAKPCECRGRGANGRAAFDTGSLWHTRDRIETGGRALPEVLPTGCCGLRGSLPGNP